MINGIKFYTLWSLGSIVPQIIEHLKFVTYSLKGKNRFFCPDLCGVEWQILQGRLVQKNPTYCVVSPGLNCPRTQCAVKTFATNCIKKQTNKKLICNWRLHLQITVLKQNLMVQLLSPLSPWGGSAMSIEYESTAEQQPSWATALNRGAERRLQEKERNNPVQCAQCCVGLGWKFSS